jgi:hypothetical protein
MFDFRGVIGHLQFTNLSVSDKIVISGAERPTLGLPRSQNSVERIGELWQHLCASVSVGREPV